MKRKIIDICDNNICNNNIHNNKLLKLGISNEKIYFNNGIYNTFSNDSITKSIIHILNNIQISEMLLNFINIDKNFYIYNNNILIYKYPIDIKDLIILQFNNILKKFRETGSPVYLKLFLKIKNNNLYKYLDMENNNKFKNECIENIQFLNNVI